MARIPTRMLLLELFKVVFYTVLLSLVLPPPVLSFAEAFIISIGMHCFGELLAARHARESESVDDDE